MYRLAAHFVTLRPVRLSPIAADKCYALAWLAQPTLTPARWRSFVRAHGAGRKRGLMTIEDGRGHFHALYSFAVEPGLSLVQVLRIRLYAVSTFPGLDVYSALLNSFQAVGQQCSCARIAVDLSECANRGMLSRDLMLQSGFEKVGDTYAKII